MLPSVLSSTSASRLKSFSRLNGWPMRSPVNASPASSRMPPHDSGASVVRYTFTARDFHSLLFAGFAGALINDRTIGWAKPEGWGLAKHLEYSNSEIPDGYVKVVNLYIRMVDGGELLNPAGCRFTAEHKGFSQ